MNSDLAVALNSATYRRLAPPALRCFSSRHPGIPWLDVLEAEPSTLLLPDPPQSEHQQSQLL